MLKTNLSFPGTWVDVLNLEPYAFFIKYNQTLLMEIFMFFVIMLHVYIAYICIVACIRYGCARKELKGFYKFCRLFASSVHSPVNAWSPVKVAEQNYINCSKCALDVGALLSINTRLEACITKIGQIFFSFHIPEC
jgi:hypothetical protein